MKAKFLIITSVVFASDVVQAAGGAGHGSMSDLIAPLINVSILVGALIYFTKKPLSDYFKGLSVKISQDLERASLKSKEAKILLEAQERKNAHIPNEIKEIEAQAANAYKDFEHKSLQENQARFEKLKVDAVQKLEAERKEYLNELNSQLLDQVILKTKSKIHADKSLRENASKNLMGRI